MATFLAFTTGLLGGLLLGIFGKNMLIGLSNIMNCKDIDDEVDDD